MTRILVRAGKSPLTALSAEQSLAVGPDAIFGVNPGNLLYAAAAWRTLSVQGAELVPDGYAGERPGSARLASQVNRDFDRVVIPLANAFRPHFLPYLDNLTSFIKRLRVPVTVLGVGAQLDVTGRVDDLPSHVRRSVSRFVGAVLDRSTSIGVRGEITARLLRDLGFAADQIDVIGCPTMFGSGIAGPMRRRVNALTAESSIVVHYTKRVKGVGRMVAETTSRYPRSVVVPQTAGALALQLWGETIPGRYDADLPESRDHPLYLEDRIRFFVDASTWIDYLRSADFTFGTRIHGTMAGVLAGTPSVLIAHDSRTRELAEYHGIPHRPVDMLAEGVDPARLYSETDFSVFDARQPETFSRFVRFLERNGLDHVHQPGRENPAYDRALADAPLARPVATLMATGIEGRRQIVDRLTWLREGARVDAARSTGAYVRPFPRKSRWRRVADSLRGIQRRVQASSVGW